MPDLPETILHTFQNFAQLFSRPVFKNIIQLFIGHILCKGRRTIADVLRQLQLSNLKNFSKFHWVLSGAKWSPLQGARLLLLQIVKLLVQPIEELIIPIDTTIERRKGPKIKGLGRQRDPTRSTKGRKVLTIGLQWLVASVIVKVPYSSRFWALPFFTQLIPPPRPLSTSENQSDLKKIKKHKKLTDWAAMLPRIIRRFLGKDCKFVIVADHAFACYKIAHACINANASLISRLRLDARIFEFPKVFRNGRPRLVGKRLPIFRKMLKDENLPWEEFEVNWYGGGKKILKITTRVSLWYGYGIPPVKIRWVLVKDSAGSLEPVALFSTNTEHTPQHIIEVFVNRWQLEVTFEEARRHLGVETQRQWSDKAIERTTPCLFASFSMITLMGINLAQNKNEKIPLQRTSWYKKDFMTFSDLLTYVRMNILRKKYFSQFTKKGELGKMELEELILQAAAA